jgi:O-antigen/teichoic acid export membrane protein
MHLNQMREENTQPPLSPQSPAPTRGPLALGRRVVKVCTTFFLGQGALQGIQVLVGLLLVRELSIEAYAQFGLAYGFQLTMDSLMNLGFTSTIVPLIGGRRDDRQLVGRYVRSAKHWRNRTFWTLAPFTAIVFFAIMHKHHWNWGVQIALVVSVLVALYSSGRVSYFSAPLFVFGRLREFYVPQTVTACGRLIAYVVCNLAGILNSWVAAGLSALNVSLNGIYLEKEARRLLVWPKDDDPATDREVFQYILPAMPAILLGAFYSQISLLLISIFGQTTSIAQVAALNKLGQLFAVFMTFNVVIIEPYVARLSRERLLSTYLGFIATNAVLCVPVVVLAFAFPDSFLWVLGRNYAGLGKSVGWVVLAGCINQIAGLMWVMNRSRKWLFWSGTILEITLLLIVQVTYIVLVGVHTTQQAVLFTFASSFCYIVTHAYVGIYGFLKGPRNASTSDALNEI